MNSTPSRWIDPDPQILALAGASHVGIAEAMEVDNQAQQIYRSWIADGCNGSMSYLEKYDALRSDPRLLLDNAQSVICFAFPYFHPGRRNDDALPIARYARGRDYHDILRQRLTLVVDGLTQNYGGAYRICIDTAPLRERYWAMRSGLGFIGLNNQLIIPGSGSYFFLGEILSTIPFRPDPVGKQTECERCGRCVRACPTGALEANGRCNASKCLSYLTIEHRGDFPEGTDLHGSFYGCDRCASVCPHNASPRISTIEEFAPDPRRTALTRADILSMTPETFAETFRGSAMKRAKLAGLQRNARAIAPDTDR